MVSRATAATSKLGQRVRPRANCEGTIDASMEGSGGSLCILQVAFGTRSV